MPFFEIKSKTRMISSHKRVTAFMEINMELRNYSGETAAPAKNCRFLPNFFVFSRLNRQFFNFFFIKTFFIFSLDTCIFFLILTCLK